MASKVIIGKGTNHSSSTKDAKKESTLESLAKKVKQIPMAYKIAAGIFIVGTVGVLIGRFACNMDSTTAGITEVAIAGFALCILGSYHANKAWDAYKKKKEEERKLEFRGETVESRLTYINLFLCPEKLAKFESTSKSSSSSSSKPIDG